MAKQNKKTVNWRIPQDHYDALKRLSEEEERPMSYFVDKALEAYLKSKGELQ